MTAPELARELWADLTPSERYGVQFGLFPVRCLEAEERAGLAGASLAVELMQLAAKEAGAIDAREVK